MQRYILLIDGLSTLVGKTFAWLIVILVAATVYDVIARYLFRAPTGWAFDVSYFLYATFFMMGGAYALARNQHVRGDIFFRLWPVRVQAAIEFVLLIAFFFPGIVALMSAGFQFFAMSYDQLEVTQTSFVRLPLYPLKAVIPIAGTVMFIQGLAELGRSYLALRHGVWPPRLSDVEETETVLARAETL